MTRSMRRILWCLVVLAIPLACRQVDRAALKTAAVQRGDALMEQRQYGEAIGVYQDAVTHDPTDADIRLKLAAAYRGAGQWGDAAQAAVRAADLRPENLDAQLQAAAGLVSQRQFGDALHRLEPILARNPREQRALVLLANARAQLVTFMWALVRLEEALRLGADMEAVRRDLRPLTLREDDRAAEQAFRLALEIEPGMADAQLGLINLLWATGRIDEGAVLLRQAADDDPPHAFLSRALAMFYLSRGRVAEAEKYLQSAVSFKDVEAGVALANHYVSINRSDEAVRLLDALAAGAVPGAATLHAADIELRQGRPADAMRRADAVLAREPRNAQALQIRARGRLDVNDVPGALEAARLAIATAPQSGEARSLLGRALQANGEFERAFDELSEAIRLIPRDPATARHLAAVALIVDRPAVAAEYARQTLRHEPNDHTMSVTLVKALVRTGELLLAERALAPLLQKSATADVLVLQGAIQAARHHRDAARASYQRALQLDGNSLDALSGLVAVELEDRQAARVRPRVAQAVVAHPRNPEFLLLSAQISDAEGDARGAETTLGAALALAPGHVAATRLLSDILVRQNRPGEAKRLVDQALVHRPSSSELEFLLAGLLEGAGQIAEARVRYERLVARGPSVAAAAARLAALHVNHNGDLDVALGLASTAKQQLPHDPEVSDILGWIYVRKGLPARGIPHLEDAVRAAPDRAVFRYHLGVAYQGTKAVAKARDELTRALEINPQFPGAPAARAALAALPR